MKKLLPLLLTLSICLWAADFWASKPFTDWSEKDVQKMENSSPWSKQISVQVGGGSSGGGSGKGRSKGGGGSGGGEIESMGSATGGMGVGGGSRGGQEGSSGGGGSSLNLTVSWRTALPIRQAVAKEKFGKEAGTSPEAKKLIEEDQKYYAILLTGLPGRAIGNGEKLKAMLLKTSSLSVKGKDPIAPADVQAGTSEQKTLVLFLFPKTTAFDLDDKDVEFSTQLGPLNVKQKFHLKDMVFNGKLEL